MDEGRKEDGLGNEKDGIHDCCADCPRDPVS